MTTKPLVVLISSGFITLAALTSLSGCVPVLPGAGPNCDGIELGTAVAQLEPVKSTSGKGPDTICGTCVLGAFVRKSAVYECCMYPQAVVDGGGGCGIDCQQYADSLTRVYLGGKYINEDCGRRGTTSTCSVFVRDGGVEAVHTFCQD